MKMATLSIWRECVFVRMNLCSESWLGAREASGESQADRWAARYPQRSARHLNPTWHPAQRFIQPESSRFSPVFITYSFRLYTHSHTFNSFFFVTFFIYQHIFRLNSKSASLKRVLSTIVALSKVNTLRIVHLNYP
jgi:hypothetical protein